MGLSFFELLSSFLSYFFFEFSTPPEWYLFPSPLLQGILGSFLGRLVGKFWQAFLVAFINPFIKPTARFSLSVCPSLTIRSLHRNSTSSFPNSFLVASNSPSAAGISLSAFVVVVEHFFVPLHLEEIAILLSIRIKLSKNDMCLQRCYRLIT